MMKLKHWWYHDLNVSFDKESDQSVEHQSLPEPFYYLPNSKFVNLNSIFSYFESSLTFIICNPTLTNTMKAYTISIKTSV